MIDYVEDIWVLFQCEGSVMGSALMQALPSTVLAFIICLLSVWWPEIREESGWANLNIVGLTWNAMTVCIGMLLGLRIKQALGRFWEGTTLLHQMRGEWFDATSCLISFSRDAKVNKDRAKEVSEFRSTLIRLMSLMHGSALDEISSDESDVKFEVLDVAGLDTTTLMFLRGYQKACKFSKVEALQHLIQVLVTDNYHRGVLSIPAPILSRVYQTLSRGFVNLLNARKIKDTMFPFPFVQTIKILFVAHSFVTPAVMTTVFETNFWAILFTFVPLFGLHCLNLTSMQLEMPFGEDPNDLPLANFQEEMNDTLLMLVCDHADHCPGTSLRAIDLTTGIFTNADIFGANTQSFERDSFFSVQMQNVPSVSFTPSFMSSESIDTKSENAPKVVNPRGRRSRRPMGKHSLSAASTGKHRLSVAKIPEESNTRSLFDDLFLNNSDTGSSGFRRFSEFEERNSDDSEPRGERLKGSVSSLNDLKRLPSNSSTLKGTPDRNEYSSLISPNGAPPSGKNLSNRRSFESSSTASERSCFRQEVQFPPLSLTPRLHKVSDRHSDTTAGSLDTHDSDPFPPLPAPRNRAVFAMTPRSSPRHPRSDKSEKAIGKSGRENLFSEFGAEGEDVEREIL